MYQFKKPLFRAILLSGLLTGCSVAEKYKDVFNFQEVETKITEQEVVYIYCDEGNIDEYVNKGWSIIDSQAEEVPCSWKTERSRPGCNLNSKGCQISVPDKIGKQIKYTLEREINDDKATIESE